jgi:hypothetical protein
VGDLAHGSEMILSLLDGLETLEIVRLSPSLDESLKSLLMRVPLLNLGGLKRLWLLGGGRGFVAGLADLPGDGLLLGHWLLRGITLPLPAPRPSVA